MSMIADQKKRLKNCYGIFVIRHSRFFNQEWYCGQVDEQLSVKESAAHYWNGGWKRYNPSVEFDTQLYLRDNPDVAEAGICPLYHFERHGKHEGGRNILFFAGKGHYHEWRALRGARRKWGIWRCRGLIAKNKSARILVCLQLFYPDSWREIKEYLKNLAPYSYDLVVTYPLRDGMEDTLRLIQEFRPGTKMLMVKNVGFDLGGFQAALRQVSLAEYDIVFKIHSKGTSRKHTYVYHHYFGYRDWFIYLYEGILGAKTVHLTIDKLLHKANCGLVAAHNLILSDPPHKQRLLQNVLKTYQEIVIPRDYRYVAGTCFAQKAYLLEKFSRMSFDFTASRRGEFSLAHALERAVCFNAQENGMELIGNSICGLRRIICSVIGRRFHTDVAEELMSDPRFDLDDEFFYRDLEHLRIKGYELTEICLGKIRRRWFDGSVKTLEECAPYLYMNGNKDAYDAYCAYHTNHSLSSMTQERFDALIHSIEQDGFDPRKPLVLRSDGTIMDGQHRACCLLKLYGEEYRVPTIVLK